MVNSEIGNIKSTLTDLASDNVEVLIDSTLDSGVLKDIPVLGSFVKLYRAGKSIRDVLFTNKLEVFLKHSLDIDADVRHAFYEKLDKEESEYLGERLIDLIERIDGREKAMYIAKAFKLYVNGSIDKLSFFDLCYAIENIKSHYIQLFIESYHIFFRVTPEENNHYITCGLAEPITYNQSKHLGGGLGILSITEIGDLFLNEIVVPSEKSRRTIMEHKIVHISEIKKDSEFFESNNMLIESFSEDTLINFLRKIDIDELELFKENNNIISYNKSESSQTEFIILKDYNLYERYKKLI